MKEVEIGKRYLMPSSRVAVLKSKTHFGYNFEYEDGGDVGITAANLRYVVEAAPK
jgi:hypothetical protein